VSTVAVTLSIPSLWWFFLEFWLIYVLSNCSLF
jgi:hypothetical protein